MLLKYDFSAVNVQSVRHAMRDIEGDMLRHNRRLAEGAGGGRRGGRARGVTAVQDTAKADERAAAKAAATQVKLHERAERAKTKATEREALARAKAEGRAQEYERKQRTQHFQEENRQEQRWAEYNRRLKERHFRDEQRNADRAVLHQQRIRGRIYGATRGVLGNTVSSVAAVGRGAVAMSGLAGGALFANAVHGSMSRTAKASDLANQLLGNEATPEKLAATKKKILGITGAIPGVADEQMIAGMSAFQAVAGESEATTKVAPKLAKTQLATGGDLESIGEMYANVYASLRNASGGAAKSVDQLLKETDEMAMVFAAMGQKGAIELRDFAKIGGSVAATATRYGGTQSENIKNVAAVAQISRQTGGATSPEEAETALHSFTADVIQNGKAIKKMGVDVYEPGSKGTKLKQLPQLIPELLAATGGKLSKLGEVANIRGAKALYGFQDPYLDAYNAAKKAKKTEKQAKEAGKAAVASSIAGFGGIAMTEGERDTKAESRLNDADKQLEANFRALNRAVGDELIPEVTKLIPEIAKLTPYLVDLAKSVVSVSEWFANHSIWEGLGAIAAGALVLEIGKAGIPAILGAGFKALLGLIPGVGAATGTAGVGTTVATTGGVIAGAIGKAATGTVAALGVGGTALAVGGALAAGAGIYYGGKGRERQTGITQRKAGQIQQDLDERLGQAGGGLWGTAVAEEQAKKELRALSIDNMLRGGGQDAREVFTETKKEITEKTTRSIIGADQAKGLESAMRKLTGAVRTMSPAPRRGETPTWLGDKP
jgi:hypothetical protein